VATSWQRRIDDGQAIMKTSALRRRTPLRPGNRRSYNSTLRTRSKKAEAIAPARREFVLDYLTEHPTCEIRWDENCYQRAIEVHEPLTRARGGSILSEENALAVCRYCHSQAHNYPAEATERGFLRSRWS
jgi:hypothetical protein